ncbi:MAG: repair protein SbcC/Rad50 [Thermoplasmata archaeon]|nr:repair protein SbcC/Rad50 [Thermoplasmata archaeon]
MRLRRLVLQNYRRYRDADLAFPDGVLAIVGRNGSGKSTLLEAIGFALFGADAMRTAKEHLRSDQAGPGDAVRVELEAEVGGQRLRVVRELRGKGLTPTCTLEVDGQVLVPGGGGSNAAATQEVERRLGVDWEGFCSTVVARQGELARLAAKKPAERKQLLLRMLGVDQVQDAIARAREARGKAEAALLALRATALDPHHLAAELAAARGEAQAAALASDTAAQRAVAAHAAREAAEAARRAADQLAQARKQRDDLAAWVAEATTAAAELGRLAPLAEALPAAEAALQAAVAQDAAHKAWAQQARLVERQRRIVAQAQPATASGEDPALLRHRIAEAQERLTHLAHLGGDAPCPTCDRPLAGTVEALRARLEASVAQWTAGLQAAEARQRHEREARKLADLEEHLGSAVPAVDLAPLQSAVQQARAAREALAHAQAGAARAAPLAAQLREADERLALLQAPAVVPDLAAARAEEEAARRAAAQATARAHAAGLAVARLEERVAVAHQQQAQAREAEAALRLWTALADGRQGGLLERFRDHLVSRVGPAVSHEASRLMGTFTGGRYSEVLLDESFEVYLADGGTHYTLDRFSGGEADLVHLALRLAVSRLLAERSGGAELRMLALDEVFGSLDRERRDLVVQALHQLGGLYAQVLVISHLEGLEEMLDDAILVEEAAGAARLMHNA